MAEVTCHGCHKVNTVEAFTVCNQGKHQGPIYTCPMCAPAVSDKVERYAGILTRVTSHTTVILSRLLVAEEVSGDA